ncbi:putative claudin-1-like [Scophthalmus maximus]|uniref:Putative claudin-1-like n=1 Tax=Scophthalmus maximus TaxID=52904 RepID=A0A2U9C2N7_SCOMX|nr:claudin-1 [Scophthalmus maximus]XP_035502526.1 claudin-1 [Scophthalmus maximus]AWP10914.1 putative claudin-1-like [Scophthalmus maximus]
MASSGMQLLGFFLSLLGVSATVAATFMVEWKRQAQGKTHRIYEGLWMSCSGNERTTCELYESLLKLPTEVQATRAVMLLSVFLSAVALMVSTVGMKCTRFMDDKSESKSTTAMIGGIMFMVSGLVTVVITSWYVDTIVKTFHTSNKLQSFEFGRAVFVSWAGGVLTMAGGAFLSCRRCSRSRLPASMNSNQLLPTVNSKSNYV